MGWSERKKGWVIVGVFGGLLALAIAAPWLQSLALRGGSRDAGFNRFNSSTQPVETAGDAQTP
jgi:hypothetical protein